LSAGESNKSGRALSSSAGLQRNAPLFRAPWGISSSLQRTVKMVAFLNGVSQAKSHSPAWQAAGYHLIDA